jgi:hypothetical protein
VGITARVIPMESKDIERCIHQLIVCVNDLNERMNEIEINSISVPE